MTGLEIGLLATGIGSAVGNLISQVRTSDKTYAREDNAVQRRARDLAAAGLNPNLAAGSAASSNVVGAPQLNINPGQLLDAATAVEQIKQQREATKAAQSYSSLMDAQAKQAKLDYARDAFNTFYNYGFDVEPSAKGGEFGFHWNSHWSGNSLETNLNSNFGESPFLRALSSGLQTQEYQRDLLRKQDLWYNTNQVLNQVWNGLDAVTDVAHAGTGIYDMFKPESITTSKSRQYSRRGYTETTTQSRRR